MGPLMLGMAGILCFTPLIGQIVQSPATHLGKLLRVDPAVFSSILACDMGGYPLAKNLAQEYWTVPYCGMLLGSMLGCTVSFILPMGVNLIHKTGYVNFFQGILLGMVGIPAGSLTGGMLAGFPVVPMLWMTLPVIFLSLGLLAGLHYFQRGVLLGCRIFARLLNAISILGLLAGSCSYLLGWQVFSGMGKIQDAVLIVGGIALFLSGALPLMELLLQAVQYSNKENQLENPLLSILLLIAVNPVPVLMKYESFSTECQIKSAAFMVCASCVMGDHLGYVANVASDFVVPLLVGKILGGLTALGVAELYCKKKIGKWR